MSTSSPRSSVETARSALRRLTLDQLEPTPENYARAYAQEAGRPLMTPDAAAAPVPLAGWIERVVRGLERGGKNWTNARKKDSLQHVLAGSRSDVQRLQQRLGQLITQWERDQPDDCPADGDDEAPAVDAGATTSVLPLPPVQAQVQAQAQAQAQAAAALIEKPNSPVPRPMVSPDLPPEVNVAQTERAAWNQLFGRLAGTVQVALPPKDALADGIASELVTVTRDLERGGADAARADALSALCDRTDRVLKHRHRLVAQLTALCEELTGSLTDLAEDDSWARGQCEAMRLRIEEGLTARGVKSVAEMLRITRARQGQLRHDRDEARDALKTFIHQMLGDLGELGQQTGRFHESVGRYADVIERADTLESLAGVVREMVVESRTVESLVGQAQRRLHDEHERATALSARVSDLEDKLRRLSDEVLTDQLTQVANRRGLMATFKVERARQARKGGEFCMALLDVDNFKKLNDELGHRAGDDALKALAALVARTLRPTDLVARYGGEEFVLLLPDTPLAEAQRVLVRLQRALTGGLFMHDDKQVLVTFSAGVTLLRDADTLETALDRADQALYEAKRAGKNCSRVA